MPNSHVEQVWIRSEYVAGQSSERIRPEHSTVVSYRRVAMAHEVVIEDVYCDKGMYVASRETHKI